MYPMMRANTPWIHTVFALTSLRIIKWTENMPLNAYNNLDIIELVLERT